MNVDPRSIKQLLQLNMINTASLLSAGSNSTTETDGSSFAELLQELVSSTNSAQNAANGRDGMATAIHNLNITFAATGGTMQTSPLASDMLSRKSSADKAYLQGSLQSSSTPTAYEAQIQAASIRYGVDAALIKAVIYNESSFNPDAVSKAGAKGLMQLMDKTASGLGVVDSFDPKQNIEGGSKYLADLILKYKGEEGVALAAYNAGPGRIDRLGIATDADLEQKMTLLPLETQAYVRKVNGSRMTY